MFSNATKGLMKNKKKKLNGEAKKYIWCWEMTIIMTTTQMIYYENL